MEIVIHDQNQTEILIRISREIDYSRLTETETTQINILETIGINAIEIDDLELF